MAKIAILKQTRVRVDLIVPTGLDLPDGPQDVVAVKLYADDPRGLVAAARERLDPDEPSRTAA